KGHGSRLTVEPIAAQRAISRACRPSTPPSQATRPCVPGAGDARALRRVSSAFSLHPAFADQHPTDRRDVILERPLPIELLDAQRHDVRMPRAREELVDARFVAEDFRRVAAVAERGVAADRPGGALDDEAGI